MRYEDWDVLLFPCRPDGSIHVPSKEFGTNCFVIADKEAMHTRQSPGLPIVTTTVPHPGAGQDFHLSVHTWSLPTVSAETRNYSEHVDLVKYYCRVWIDGNIAASAIFDRDGGWPLIIAKTFNLQDLDFPDHRDHIGSLTINRWTAGDDHGRIKLVISEGFPRDSETNPIEITKNIVCFSFRYIPMDVLVDRGVAWPNPSMWQAGTSMLRGPETHMHGARSGSSPFGLGSGMAGYAAPMTSSPSNVFHGQAMASFPFAARRARSSATMPASMGFRAPSMASVSGTGRLQQRSSPLATSLYPDPTAASTSYGHSIDTSMRDFSGSGHEGGFGFHVAGQDNEDGGLHSFDFNAPMQMPTPNSAIHPALASSLTHSLLSQPAPLPLALNQTRSITQPIRLVPSGEVRSRKEKGKGVENRRPRRQLSSVSSISSVRSTPTKRQRTMGFSQAHGHGRNLAAAAPMYGFEANPQSVDLTRSATSGSISSLDDHSQVKTPLEFGGIPDAPQMQPSDSASLVSEDIGMQE